MRIRSLYLNIYITVVTVLLLFALVAGLLVQYHSDGVRERIDTAVAARNLALGAILQKSLPPPGTDSHLLQTALQERADALQQELALEDAQGRRLAETRSYASERHEPGPPVTRVPLADGRVLLMGRPRMPWEREWRGGPDGQFGDGPPPGPMPGGRGPGEPRRHEGRGRPDDYRDGGPPPGGPRPGEERADEPDGNGAPLTPHSVVGFWARRWLDQGLLLLVVLFAAIAAGSYPVVRRLTRRLEALRRGVETFGAGALDYRVPVQGSDEVSAVAASFNRAAQRIEDLVRANRSLLANASHELRSPLARLKMAVSMIHSVEGEARADLHQEIDRDISELDALVEEVLLASRLDAQHGVAQDPVDMPAVVAEEAMRLNAEVDVAPQAMAVRLSGEERLLRRAVRNLLENARRYGGDDVRAEVAALDGRMVVRVCDRGPGVPPSERERIFEPFYRLPGHSEMAGGVGLGLALVRQIAQRHGGSVHCEPREGGGSCFSFSVPLTTV